MNVYICDITGQQHEDVRKSILFWLWTGRAVVDSAAAQKWVGAFCETMRGGWHKHSHEYMRTRSKDKVDFAPDLYDASSK
ncbi:hypothetical protein EVAR_6802_1 [Eumeta japonica]|uniref:Uncharacterized protein n=1 Tax=Eumeta variegata TaxID=151549 RepID=A0A4C1U6C6_EUMVA|nr:hypothetical protein EVAR_6802_1 [Eumeta japonica]